MLVWFSYFWPTKYPIVTSDESEPSWLELKDFQLGSARDLFPLKKCQLGFSSEIEVP